MDDRLDILVWVMGGGFTIMLTLMLLLYREIKDVGWQVRETNTRVSEIDKRLYGIETVLHMKDCCMLKADQNIKKAE